MATYTEMTAITRDYFMTDNGKAVDIYFNSSFLLNFLLKQKKGIWERPDGGKKIRIPLEYDGQESGFYGRGDTISSDDRETLNAAYFEFKHAYGNATILRVDELENSGEYAEVQLITQKVAGAQKSLTKTLASSIYDAPGGSSNRLDGLLALCNEDASLAYGNIAENDLVSNDGTKPWEGKVTTTSETISLKVLRTMATNAKMRDGVGGKPNIVTMPETLWNALADILQVQQRFVDSSETANAGFVGFKFEGKDVCPDDYCPSGYAFALNSNHIGFGIHRRGNMARTPWRMIPSSPDDKTMKIYLDGNLVCNNRLAHIAHSNLSA